MSRSAGELRPDSPIKDLSEEAASQLLQELAEIIAYHDARYHAADEQTEPEISDAEYDALIRLNRDVEAVFPGLIRTDSPSVRVGIVPAGNFAKITHTLPMLSLGNAFDEEDLFDFTARIRRFLSLPEDSPLEMTAEPKIDGLSLSLRYEKGKLIYAATRGDGTIGEDVTANIRTLKEVPDILAEEIPDVFEVRGEVYMRRSDFAALNSEQEKQGEEKFLPIPEMQPPARFVKKMPKLPPAAICAFLPMRPGHYQMRLAIPIKAFWTGSAMPDLA